MTRWIAAFCCLISLACMAWMAKAAEPAIGTNMGVKIDLKSELQMGLKARRPCEFQYIDQIVGLVESGEIPRSLVDSTFIWARKQPTRQLQSFQFALRARADKLGVVTPNLENQFISPFTGKLPSSSVVRSSPPKNSQTQSASIVPTIPIISAIQDSSLPGSTLSRYLTPSFIRARAARAGVALSRSVAPFPSASTIPNTTGPVSPFNPVSGSITSPPSGTSVGTQSGLTSSSGIVPRTFSRIFSNRLTSTFSNPLSTGS